ncbi:MAG: hypothetical protein ACLP9L_31235 [Thermoguttaceae bacterium]
MKTPPALLALVLAATVSSLCAQQPVRVPLTELAPPQPSSSVADHLVRQVSFKKTTLLDEALRSLESECPGFQTVIVRDPGCTDVNPVLPDMSLKNLPLSQVLDVIAKSLPEVTVDKVSSSKGDVWIFRIHETNPDGANFGRPGRSPGRRPVRVEQPMVAPTPAQPTVMVYRLSPLIRTNAADRSKTLNDILSLVQASLDATVFQVALDATAVSTKVPYLMKLHAPTETLIFRGYPTELEVVDRTLKALELTPDEIGRSKWLEQADNDRARLMAEMDRLKEAMAQTRVEASDARNRVNQQTEEIEKLRARLRSLGEKSQ